MISKHDMVSKARFLGCYPTVVVYDWSDSLAEGIVSVRLDVREWNSNLCIEHRTTHEQG